MIPFSQFISEAVAIRPKKPSKAKIARQQSTAAAKEKILRQKAEFNHSWGMSSTDDRVWYTDFGHDDESPYPNQKELDQIHQKVWGVSKTGKPPDLWVASPQIKPSKGMKYVTIRTLKNLNHTHSEVFDDVGGVLSYEPQMQGRVDHNRKVISATTIHLRGGSRYSSRTVDAIFAELKKRYPGYQIVDMIDEGKIARFGRFLRERKHFLPRYRHEDHRN